MSSALAQEHPKEMQIEFGGDKFSAGFSVNISREVNESLFAAGHSIIISAPVADDIFAFGNVVAIDSDVGGDVYAAGNSLTMRGKVADDLSMFGATINIDGDFIQGNVRLAGGNILINAPIGGSLIIGAETANINSLIEGDFSFSGENIVFSENAKINGQVTIRAVTDVNVPPNVAPPERVVIEKIEASEYGDKIEHIMGDEVKGFFPIWLGKITALAILFVIGVIWLAIFKKTGSISYKTAMIYPIRSTFFGILALAAFIGLIPVLAMTIIGIIAIPIFAIILFLAIIIGFVAGSYFVGGKIMSGFNIDLTTLGGRTIALIGGLIGVFLLSLIPFIGWLILLFILFFGLGAISHAALARFIDRDFYQKIEQEN